MFGGGRYFAPTRGLEACAPCGAGHYATDAANDTDNSGVLTGAAACVECGAGYYAAAERSNLCAVCAAGKTSSPGAPACTECLAGYYLCQKQNIHDTFNMVDGERI